MRKNRLDSWCSSGEDLSHLQLSRPEPSAIEVVGIVPNRSVCFWHCLSTFWIVTCFKMSRPISSSKGWSNFDTIKTFLSLDQTVRNLQKTCKIFPRTGLVFNGHEGFASGICKAVSYFSTASIILVFRTKPSI